MTPIYETRQQDITSKVAESTNSQTPVKSRDLRSNDAIQKKLEESFRDLGYYYERKVRQYETEAPELRIDSLAAGQAYLAFYENLPEVAKKDRARIFGDLYEVIFNDDITAEKLLLSFLICRQIESRKRDAQGKVRNNQKVDEREWFAVEGTYHVLNAVKVFCELLQVDEPREEDWMPLIPHAIALIGDAVSSEVQQDHFFSSAKFFKDGKTKGRLHALAFKYGIEQLINDPMSGQSPPLSSFVDH